MILFPFFRHKTLILQAQNAAPQWKRAPQTKLKEYFGKTI